MTLFAPGSIAGRTPRVETPPTPRAARYAGPTTPERNPDWRAQAVCANTSQIDMWFPQGTVGVWAVQIEAAKAACMRCPVLANCEELLADMRRDLGPHLAGIWAGTSEEDRNQDRSRARRSAERARQRAKKAAV